MLNNLKLTSVALLVSALAVGGCQKTEEPANTTTQSTKQATAQVAVTDTPTSAEAKGVSMPEVTYKTITATLRDTGEKIQLQVPENEGIDSGRLIELREMADGTYTYKSVIPQ